MTSRESARHLLYARLEEVLGHDHADTLMTSLPYETAHLATKRDIANLEKRFERLEDRFDRFEDRFDGLGAKLDQQIRTYVVNTVGAMTGLTAIFAVLISIVR